MKMRFILPLLLLFTVTVFGQQTKQEKREQIKALKVSFITTELNLTSEQSAKFWPVYQEFEQKQFRIRHEKMRPLIRKIDEVGIDEMSDKEASSYLSQLEDADKELCDLRKKLVADLKSIIGPVKVLKLKKAEIDFDKQLLKKYKNKKK